MTTGICHLAIGLHFTMPPLVATYLLLSTSFNQAPMYWQPIIQIGLQ